VIAEGVEREDEARCLRDLGITLMQGYYFSKPVFERVVRDECISWVP